MIPSSAPSQQQL
uniref:Uncharacterized protein n=1 Tax=Arundo donax TaxID=35708 RepID=A0A0A9HHS0_ARUDO